MGNNYNNNILVTGGCGFIGYALSKQLIKLGYNVDVIDNLYIGEEAKIPEGCNFFEMDIRHINTNFIDKNYKYIFHLAAISRIQHSFEIPDTTFSINAIGTRCVVQYAKKNNCKLIYSGSSSRHHNPEMSPYAMSKHIGELICKVEKRCFDLNCEIVRFYNVYGEGELVHSHMAAVIGIFRNRVKKGIPITIHGDGEQRRDFTYIDDIVDGLIKVAESNEKNEDAWELGAGYNYSINEVFDMFNQNFKNLQKEHVSDVRGNYRETIRINNDAIDILGWSPKNYLPEYIKNLNNE